MKRWVQSRRDSSETIKEIESSLGLNLRLPKSAQAQCVEPEDGVIFVSLGDLTFVEADGKYVPYLGSPEVLALFPSATVDEGAIRFLLNGADVMRPGIRKFDEWGEAGSVVVVKEEKRGRSIAVGLSTVPSSEARRMTKGSCLRNLHYVGDKFWNLHKTV